MNLKQLNFKFVAKPLLIGGKAMEYYGLRKSGADIDFVISGQDYERLAKKYPDNLKNLYGDLGVCVAEFEIWKTICLFDYHFLVQGALEQQDHLVISLEKLLFLKALAMQVPKYQQDLLLIVERVRQLQYQNYEEGKQ
jgi:hypothetical protein